MKQDISSIRSVVDSLTSDDQLLISREAIDPIYEVAGALKALEGGSPVLFENVKGYPGQRIFCNPFSTNARVANMFGATSVKDIKRRGLDAFKNPIPARTINSAPCQEVVITGDDIDVLKLMPILKYTETDPGRILGGLVYLSGSDVGSCVSYKRMHFQGKNWASLAFIPGSHFEHWVLARRKENRNLPLTINISAPPAVIAVASGGGIPTVIPAGSDELGFAGGLQGSPVDIVPAVTVDAYSIANAEWVIEGYVDTDSRVWESEQAEAGLVSPAPLFPEWHGHEGEAERTYRFVVTGITHRKTNPIFDVWLAHSLQLPNILRLTNEGPLFDQLNRMSPGLITDINALDSMKQMGIVIQVRKRFRRDDSIVRNLILAAFSLIFQLRLVFVVDDDVDIYNADELIWALNTRFDPKDNMIVIPEPLHGRGKGPLKPVARIGIDLTCPKEDREHYWRGEYPNVDLEKWFSKEQVTRATAGQSDYAKLLAGKRV